MKGLPSELFLVLLIAAALLFNFVVQRAVRRQQAEAEQSQPPEEEIPEAVWRRDVPASVDARGEPAEVVAARRQAALPAASPDVSPARSRLRIDRQSLFGTRWDVQEAVVVATILGRCRADEPHDIR